MVVEFTTLIIIIPKKETKVRVTENTVSRQTGKLITLRIVVF